MFACFVQMMLYALFGNAQPVGYFDVSQSFFIAQRIYFAALSGHPADGYFGQELYLFGYDNIQRVRCFIEGKQLVGKVSFFYPLPAEKLVGRLPGQ